LPQIRQYGIGLGTPICSLGNPSRLAFHNFIGGASIELQMGFMGETLYCIIGHLNKSTKDLNICISACLTKVSRPSFKQPRTQDLKFKISLIN